MKTPIVFGLALALTLSSSLVLAQSEQAGKQSLRVGTPIASPAATINFTGDSTGGPTWNRPAVVSATDCGSSLSGVGTATPYSMQLFSVDVAGNYDFGSDQGGGKSTSAPTGGFDGYILVYADTFNPAAPFTNCVGGDDDGPSGVGSSEMLAVPLQANRTYVMVTTGFENFDFGPFTNTIAGPGNITLGAFALPERVEIDTLSSAGLLALALLLGAGGFVAVRRFS